MLFCMVYQKGSRIHLLYSCLFFKIPSQSIFGNYFAKLLTKAFRKTSIEMIEDNAANMAFLNECALLAHVHLYIILAFSKFSLTFGKFA